MGQPAMVTEENVESLPFTQATAIADNLALGHCAKAGKFLHKIGFGDIKE